METSYFFQCNSYKLFGILHAPDKEIAPLFKHKLGVVFCHPFAEEKLIAHRAMVNMARRLAEEGVYSFRFDHMGHGDSDGNFEDSTVETILADIKCAVDFFQRSTKVEKMGLLGLRLGGTLAALSCQGDLPINFLIAISPIIDGKAYFEQCLRSNLTTQMTTYGKVIRDRQRLISDLQEGQLVNLDGYLINRTLYEQLLAVDLLSGVIPHTQSGLLIQITARENQPVEKGLDMLHRKYNNGNMRTTFLRVREDPFWKDSTTYSPRKENLESSLVLWLNSLYSA